MAIWRKHSYFKSSFYEKPKPVVKPKEVKPKPMPKLALGQHMIRRGTTDPFAEILTNCRFGLPVVVNEAGETIVVQETMMVALLMDIRERLDHLIRNTEPAILTTDENLIEAAQDTFYAPSVDKLVDKQIADLLGKK